ncbi:hypothetical protein FXW78_51065 [Rhodococcus opacus]|nr:hypothetical protein [Rhodococcus opacus]
MAALDQRLRHKPGRVQVGCQQGAQLLEPRHSLVLSAQAQQQLGVECLRIRRTAIAVLAFGLDSPSGQLQRCFEIPRALIDLRSEQQREALVGPIVEPVLLDRRHQFGRYGEWILDAEGVVAEPLQIVDSERLRGNHAVTLPEFPQLQCGQATQIVVVTCENRRRAGDTVCHGERAGCIRRKASPAWPSYEFSTAGAKPTGVPSPAWSEIDS